MYLTACFRLYHRVTWNNWAHNVQTLLVQEIQQYICVHVLQHSANLSRQSNIHVQWLFVAQYWNNYCWFVNAVRSESFLRVDPLLVPPKWAGVGGHENLENSENVDTVSQGLSASSQSSIFSTRPHKWTLHILFESLMKKRKNSAPGWARTYNHSVYNGRFTQWAMGPVWLWAPLTEPGPIIVKVNRPFIFQKLVFWIPKIVRACGRETRYFSKASLTWKFSLARRAHYILQGTVLRQ